jgi:ATP phosphoribosyltransferase regulatory subunit
VARALDRKDNAAVARLGGPIAPLLVSLLEARGPVAQAIPALLAIDLPEPAKLQAIRMAEAVAAIQAHKPDLRLTADAVEFRGYQYHTGICITVFAPGRQAELGRGGRYLCGDTEPATGITLYPDTIVKAAPAQPLRQRLYLPFGTPADDAAACRAQNYATIAGLAPVPTPAAEAARLGCTHLFQNGDITRLPKDPA